MPPSALDSLSKWLEFRPRNARHVPATFKALAYRLDLPFTYAQAALRAIQLNHFGRPVSGAP